MLPCGLEVGAAIVVVVVGRSSEKDKTVITVDISSLTAWLKPSTIDEKQTPIGIYFPNMMRFTYCSLHFIYVKTERDPLRLQRLFQFKW